MLPTSPTPEKPTETISDAVIFSRIIAKNFLSIPKIAEDMSIIRRNIQNKGKPLERRDLSRFAEKTARWEISSCFFFSVGASFFVLLLVGDTESVSLGRIEARKGGQGVPVDPHPFLGVEVEEGVVSVMDDSVFNSGRRKF